MLVIPGRGGVLKSGKGIVDEEREDVLRNKSISMPRYEYATTRAALIIPSIATG